MAARAAWRLLQWRRDKFRQALSAPLPRAA
jgi:hypothetical protein